MQEDEDEDAGRVRRSSDEVPAVWPERAAGVDAPAILRGAFSAAHSAQTAVRRAQSRKRRASRCPRSQPAAEGAALGLARGAQEPSPHPRRLEVDGPSDARQARWAGQATDDEHGRGSSGRRTGGGSWDRAANKQRAKSQQRSRTRREQNTHKKEQETHLILSRDGGEDLARSRRGRGV